MHHRLFFLVLILLALNFCGCSETANVEDNANNGEVAATAFDVPIITVNIPATLQRIIPSSRILLDELGNNQLSVTELNNNTTIFNAMKCSSSDCLSEPGTGPESRGKEIGRILLMPQLIGCAFREVVGLNANNFSQLTNYNYDTYRVATDPTYPCYEYNIGTAYNSNHEAAYTNKCWDLGANHNSGYRFVCKNSTGGVVESEIAFTIDGGTGNENYTGKGHIYSINLGWFKWDITAGVSTELWTVLADVAPAGSRHYWTNYTYVKDDQANHLFTWQHMGGTDQNGNYGDAADAVTYYDGAYNYSTNYGKLRYQKFSYSSNFNALSSTPQSNADFLACVQGNSTTKRMVAACDLNSNECGGVTACDAIAASSLPTALGTPTTPNFEYLNKYMNINMGDEVNVGIRFSEIFGNYNVE